VPVGEDLESPRGRIQINEVARRGGIIEARLPCLYFRRDIDWHLNRVLRSGLAAASRVTENFELRRRLHSLQRGFGDVSVMPMLAEEDLEKAENSLSRLQTRRPGSRSFACSIKSEAWHSRRKTSPRESLVSCST
jgi:5-methylcytosine-specific restriction enzyme subunit McrC